MFLYHSFSSPLNNYITTHRDEIKWTVIERKTLSNGNKAIVLSLFSQFWKDIGWYHRVGIIFPKNLQIEEAAVLYITGGFEDLEENVWIADSFGAPFIILGDEPNQPLFGGLREDKLIAYSFQKFLETGEEDWPLLLPMVQAAIAAMDATQEILKSEGLTIEKFLVSGASKRGWTTWLTAAVDKRVFAIAPIVFDNLNFEKQLDHQIENWRSYSEQISPYTDMNFQERIHTELGKTLVKIVDPYSYLDKYNIPKLIIQGTNDRYWTIDASWFYFFDLPGKNYVLFIPNEGHGIKNIPLVVSTMSEFFKSLILKGDFVDVEWKFEDRGKRLVIASNELESCGVWLAFSDDLDFRDATWVRRKLKCEDGYCEFKVPNLNQNICYFGELVFEGYNGKFILTTIPKIVKNK